MRHLASIRQISDLLPIEGADAILLAKIDGWQCVVKKDEFQVGDQCVYFEIDSFIPIEPWIEHLRARAARKLGDKEGIRVKTIRLRGQLSQGLALPVSILDGKIPHGSTVVLGDDVTEIIGVEKYEQPISATLAGQAEGLFPSFIRKTDQERCQNLVKDIFGYEDTRELFDTSAVPAETVGAMTQAGVLVYDGPNAYRIYKARASRETRYEVTLKLDGSSTTVFARRTGNEVEHGISPVGGVGGQAAWSTHEIQSGICSRNLQLKINQENSENAFVKTVLKSNLLAVLEEFAADGRGNYAVQGELMGPGIQKNREGFNSHCLYVFNIFDIDSQQRLLPAQRRQVFDQLMSMGVDSSIVRYVPVIHETVTLDELGIFNVNDLLLFAEGKSISHPIREGLVFNRIDDQASFKAISNKYLLKEED